MMSHLDKTYIYSPIDPAPAFVLEIVDSLDELESMSPAVENAGSSPVQ